MLRTVAPTLLLLLAQCVLTSPLPHPILHRQAGGYDLTVIPNACKSAEAQLLSRCPGANQQANFSSSFDSCNTVSNHAKSSLQGQFDECGDACFSIQDRCTAACDQRYGGPDLSYLENDPPKLAEAQGCIEACRDEAFRCQDPCRAAIDPVSASIQDAGVQCCQRLAQSDCSADRNSATNPPFIQVIYPQQQGDESGPHVVVVVDELNVTTTALPPVYVPDAPVDPLSTRPPTFEAWGGGDYYLYCSLFPGPCPKLPQISRGKPSYGGPINHTSTLTTSATRSESLSSSSSTSSSSASTSATSSRFTGFPRPVPSATPSTAPAVCKSGGARAFQNFCTFLDAFQTELTFICGASAVLALVQPEFIPVVLEFCAGGAGNAALLGVLKSLTEGAIGAATGAEIPGDAPSSACFLLHDYCGENDQFSGLKRAFKTPYKRQPIPDRCTSYAAFTSDPLVATNCDSANILMDLQSACSNSLFGPAEVDSALQRLCGFSTQLGQVLPAVCQISSYIEDNKPALVQACEVVAAGNSSTAVLSPTTGMTVTGGIPVNTSIPSLTSVSVGTATATAIARISSSETSIVETGKSAIAGISSSRTSVVETVKSASAMSRAEPTPTAGGNTCQLVKHYGDSPDSPDSPAGEPEVPEIPNYPGGYYYLCADGSVPPLSILPSTSVFATSVFASSDTRSTSSITAPTAKTSQVDCRMTRFQGDSPDTPDTPDSPDGQPEVTELPEIAQDPSDPGYYWMCV